MQLDKMEQYLVVNCPSTELSFTNRAILNPKDPFAQFAHIAIRYPKGTEAFVFTVITDNHVERGQIAFNLSGRKWALIQTNSRIEAAPYKFVPQSQCLQSITFLTDFANRSKTSPLEFDTDEMAAQFSRQFVNQAFTVGQIVGFGFEINQKRIVFELKVKEMEALKIQDSDNSSTKALPVEIGLTTGNTVYLFERGENSDVKLIGGKTGQVAAPRIFNQDWDLSKLGVGGLGEEFNLIFRRAFNSRLLPPQFAAKLGTEHVKGILLYGPPGTGKTLIARQIGKMLLAREPKIVNGPEVLNKFVGESEANIRKLFAEAEEEFAKMGINSGLHVIIFDEIDSVCKARGNSASSSGAGDNVVNQLLTKIDGVEALPNVLLIGMTNRRDLIDEALLRPGRLELQVEIGLPSRQGRREIFEIHTSKLRKNNTLDPSVDLDQLADIAKNYTGAEIAGLIKAATSLAINRVIKNEEGVKIDQTALDSMKITHKDFLYAMEHDIKPALGASEDQLKQLAKPMIEWDPQIKSIRSKISDIIERVQAEDAVQSDLPYFFLLTGQPGSGLTTIAANMANETKFPFVRVCRAKAIAGKTESFKIQYIEKLFDDASRSELSCVVIDALDRILSYNEFGPRYSEAMFDLIRAQIDTTLTNGRRMLVIVTCSDAKCLEDLRLVGRFTNIIRVPSLSSPEQVQSVLTHQQETGELTFTGDESRELIEALGSLPFQMGIKKLESLIGIVKRHHPSVKVKNFIKEMHNMNIVIRGKHHDWLG